MPKRKPRKHNRPWTEFDLARLRKHASDGLSARQTGIKMARSTGAVKYKAMVEGIEFHFINQPHGVQKKLARKRIRTGDMTVTLRRRAA